MTTETLIIIGIVVVVIVAIIGKRVINKKNSVAEENPDEIYPLF